MIMNWYKTSKLADKLKEQDQNMFTICQYCDRMATQEQNGVVPDESKVWKKLTQLNPEEQREYLEAEQSIRARNPKVSLSHGICPYCFDLIIENDISTPENADEEREFIEKSLSMS